MLASPLLEGLPLRLQALRAKIVGQLSGLAPARVLRLLHAHARLGVEGVRSRGAIRDRDLFEDLWAYAHLLEMIGWRLHLGVNQAAIPLLLALV